MPAPSTLSQEQKSVLAATHHCLGSVVIYLRSILPVVGEVDERLFKFVLDNQMEYEGEMEFDLGLEGDHSDGNLGSIKVRAKASFTFDQIEPAE